MRDDSISARADAIRAILDRHGHRAVYVASTGYVSRAVHAIAGDRYDVFYMQGSMGLAPAIGLGIALHTTQDVVVLNGDGALLMSLGVTHTIRDHGPPNLFHYVLDNGCYESVGAQPCAPLEAAYPGVTQILRISRDGKPPRVDIAPPDNTRRIQAKLAAPAGTAPSEVGA
jgi:thiamine pyrophosphate-dependent acetolactate synthase large subunit-like protein